jgi:hypothetical protein
MSCGHDGCTCPPDQEASDAHLPMGADRPGADDGHAGHDGGGHRHDGRGQSGCCGGCAA